MCPRHPASHLPAVARFRVGRLGPNRRKRNYQQMKIKIDMFPHMYSEVRDIAQMQLRADQELLLFYKLEASRINDLSCPLGA